MLFFRQVGLFKCKIPPIHNLVLWFYWYDKVCSPLQSFVYIDRKIARCHTVYIVNVSAFAFLRQQKNL